MKTVALLSGGLDSTVLVGLLKNYGHAVHTLSVDYGQRHGRELQAAAAVARHYGVAHEVVALPGSLMAGSALTGGADVPDGHYTDPSMKVTVVPARNTLLLAVAAAVAVRTESNAVAYAAHAGDHTVYPDCRPEFTRAFAGVLSLCDYRPIQLVTPFVKWTKGFIVRRGAELGVPFGLTWSCYRGGDVHCGRCATCVERREAFVVTGTQDPTEYAWESSST